MITNAHHFTLDENDFARKSTTNVKNLLEET